MHLRTLAWCSFYSFIFFLSHLLKIMYVGACTVENCICQSDMLCKVTWKILSMFDMDRKGWSPECGTVNSIYIDYRFNSPKHELGPVPMFVTNAEGTAVCPLCSWAESQFSLCCQTGSNGKSVYICSKCGAETLPYGRSLSDSLSFRAFMVSYLFVQRSNRRSCMKNEIRARERRQNPVYVLTSVHMVNRCMEWAHLSDYWFLKVTQKYSLNDTDILKSAMCKIWSEF